MISAVLLAAGESRRMGDFKQLLPFGGKTFVECCAENLLKSSIGELIIVTGHRESEVRSAIGNRTVRFIHNAEYRAGMASAIKRGVRGVSENARAFIIALVDQPQVGANVIDRLIETYEQSYPLVVVPSYDGKTGHPILFDLSLRAEILGMDSEQGLRQVVRAHAERIRSVEVSTAGILEDCDLPEDYERMMKVELATR
jgi:molybdenum cofactor cytidylyltransferase